MVCGVISPKTTPFTINKMKLFLYLIAAFLIAAAAVYFWPKPKLAEGEPVREFVIELIETESHSISEDTLSAQIKILRMRLHEAKITNEVLPVPDTHQILIRLNEADTAAHEEVRTIISRTGILTFHLVHPDSERLVDAVVAGEEYIAGYKVAPLDHLDEHGAVRSTTNLLITRHPDMDGSTVKSANGGFTPGQGAMVFLSFNKKGAEEFFELTRDNVGSRLAIVIDDKVITAPTLRAPIAGGSAQIDGLTSEAEAQSLASALENPLQHHMKLLKEHTTQ